MITKELTVLNAAGFHVRDASLVCKTAQKYSSRTVLSKGGYEADCKSCMDLLSLMAPAGTVLTLKAEGSDEEQVSAAIQELFERKFYEDEFESMAPVGL